MNEKTLDSIDQFEIRIDDLTGPDVATMVQEHVESSKRLCPPESEHAFVGLGLVFSLNWALAIIGVIALLQLRRLPQAAQLAAGRR